MPFCAEAWDAISRYIYTALQGGSIMHQWTNDDRIMITCCNDGTRPVIFKIERIDVPETAEEKIWLEQQDFSTHADQAYTGSGMADNVEYALDEADQFAETHTRRMTHDEVFNGLRNQLEQNDK